MDLTPGARLGPYKIERVLGSGAMGAVYLAYDERLERRVALKQLTSSTGAAAEERLRREARAIARLNHPNIAALYDVVEQDDVAVLVMEYVEGQPLSTLVAGGRVGIDRTLDIGLQLTDALAYAHREGVIHRDIKPANVMLTRDGKVKILDLGIARITASDPSAPTKDATDTSVAAGTPAYMAPERLRRHPADVRTDIYSVGVMLFELVTGRRPYSGGDFVALSVAIGATPPPLVSDSVPDAPPALTEVVARAMAADRSVRYSSADQLRDGLLRARQAFHGAPHRVVPKPRSRRSLISGLVGLSALVATVLVWILLRPAAVPATLAIPPVHNDRPDQLDLDELGTLVQSTLARNLGQLPGITIVPGAPAAPSAADQSAPAAGYVASVTLRNAPSGIAIEVSLKRAGKTVSTTNFDGDALAVLRYATDQLAGALEQSYALDRPLTEPERRSYRKLPTQDLEALKAYLSGRTLLDTSNDPATDIKAAEAFKAAINRDAAFAFAHAGLSQAYSSLNKHNVTADFAQAMDAAQVALNHDQNVDEAHIALALVHSGLRNWSDAVEEARKAVRLTPDNDNAHRVLGAALVGNGDNGGLMELQAAVALRPRHWINYYALGRNLLLAGQPAAEAIEPLKTVKEHLPKFEPAYVNLGYAQLSAGQYDLSVGNSRIALDLDAEDHFALNNLATAYYWIGVTTGDSSKLNQALMNYRQAIKYDDKNPKLQMNLSDTYQALGKKPDAAAACVRAIALVNADPKMDPELEAVAAKCQAKQGGFEEAEGRALKAYSKAQDTQDAITKSRVLHKLAVIYALWGKPDRALDRLEDAVKLGFSPVQFKDDPDLNALKSSPRFQRLIAQPGR